MTGEDFKKFAKQGLAHIYLTLSAETKELLELTVTVYNTNEGHNADILARSKSLSDYAAFVGRIDSNKSAGMTLENAVKEATDYCISRGLMAEYLEAHISEVKHMILEEYDFDEHMKVLAEEVREETWEEASIDKAEDVARKMKDENIAIEVIARTTGLSVEKIKLL
ncbi:MAG: hypothetical protein LBN36_05110 [Clostridiales Family XIII bacterium]|jgi:hypothetical protein|nr:hypothetical protein [Clostridiales Family XIII bacterium]